MPTIEMQALIRLQEFGLFQLYRYKKSTLYQNKRTRHKK